MLINLNYFKLFTKQKYIDLSLNRRSFFSGFLFSVNRFPFDPEIVRFLTDERVRFMRRGMKKKKNEKKCFDIVTISITEENDFLSTIHPGVWITTKSVTNRDGKRDGRTRETTRWPS